MHAEPARVKSECLGLCKLDAGRGFCMGCGRTLAEIAAWPRLSAEARASVLDHRPAQENQQSKVFEVGDVSNWIVDTISKGLGTWVIGMPGALAEFPCSVADDLEVVVNESEIVARTDGGSLRFDQPSVLRTFRSESNRAIALAAPRRDLNFVPGDRFAFLGKDSRSAADLFDFGFGNPAARFCIKVEDETLSAKLMRLIGARWNEVLSAVGVDLVAMSPIRVVESAFGRLEVSSPIPPPGGRSPEGPHTHLLPNFLNSAVSNPDLVRVPSEFFPVAVFYPSSHQAN